MRRIGALIRGLPDESATWRQERAEDPWTTGEHLLAVLAETVDYWGKTNALVHGAKPHKLPKPLQITRPGQQKQERKVETDPRAIAAFFKNHVGR